jgi:hypothetical protein
MSLSCVPLLDLDRPSLADRIKAFKNSLSSREEMGTLRRTAETYNSIDDIVSLLRARAVESVIAVHPPDPPAEELSSIIEELRSKNSEVSRSVVPRSEEQTPPNIQDLVRRLTENDDDDSPEKIIFRIKNRLEIPTVKNGSLVASNKVVIDAETRSVAGVGTITDFTRNHQLVKLDSLFFESTGRSTEETRSQIPDLVLLPHQQPYIASEAFKIRSEITKRIKS